MKKIVNAQGVRSLLLGSAAAMLAVCLGVGEAQATNGYFAHGYSVKSKAMAGAGVALPLDSLAASSNPAGMVDVGNRVDVGLSLFNPNREYTVTGQGAPLSLGTVESDSDLFAIPVIGGNWMLTDTSSLGFAMYGNGGMNTDYDTATFAGFGAGSSPTGVDLSQLFVSVTYAKKFANKHSLGISPIFAFQRFQAEGLEAFAGMSSSAANVTNNGHDNSLGLGARLGYLVELSPEFSLGVSYQSRIYMDEFDDYQGLFAEQGDFDIPANFTAGIAYRATPALTFALDVQTIFYSDVDSIANSITTATGSLGDDDGAGFGWDDMTVFKLGLQWEANDLYTFRAGLSYGEQPIPETEMLFNILAPGVVETHVTAGLTRKIGENQELDLAIMRAFDKSISGANPYNAAQTIELTMDQWEVTLGYSWKF